MPCSELKSPPLPPDNKPPQLAGSQQAPVIEVTKLQNNGSRLQKNVTNQSPHPSSTSASNNPSGYKVTKKIEEKEKKDDDVPPDQTSKDLSVGQNQAGAVRTEPGDDLKFPNSAPKNVTEPEVPDATGVQRLQKNVTDRYFCNFVTEPAQIDL